MLSEDSDQPGNPPILGVSIVRKKRPCNECTTVGFKGYKISQSKLENKIELFPLESYMTMPRPGADLI